MIPLLSISYQRSEPKSHPSDGRPPNWRQRLWRRFLDWLMEPIPFPAMTYNIKPAGRRQEQENAKRRPMESPSEQEERPSPKPDKSLARVHGWRVNLRHILRHSSERSEHDLVAHDT
jgi:hypothetical protein